MEEWRAVPGYEGIYEVSNLGRFRSAVQRMRTKIGDIIGGSTNKKTGYTYIGLTDLNRTNTRYYKHRLVMLAFRPIDGCENLDVNHKDGDKANNRLDNLEWLTHQANITHARQILKAWPERLKKVRVAKGVAKGEGIASSKLNIDQVREIRRLYSEGLMQKRIATQFSITQSTVCLIVNGKQWAHVQ